MSIIYSLNRKTFVKAKLNEVPIKVQYLKFHQGIHTFHYPKFTQLKYIDTQYMKVLFIDSPALLYICDICGETLEDIQTIVFCIPSFRYCLQTYNTRNMVLLCDVDSKMICDIQQSNAISIFVGTSVTRELLSQINSERIIWLDQDPTFIEHDNMQGVELANKPTPSCLKLIKELELDFYKLSGKFYPASRKTITAQLRFVQKKQLLLTNKMVENQRRASQSLSKQIRFLKYLVGMIKLDF